MHEGNDADAPAPRGSASRQWRKSSFSAIGECVTVAGDIDGVLVRDSKRPDGGTLRLSRDQFDRWITRIKAGELDGL